MLLLGLFAGFSIASDSVPAAAPPGAASPHTLQGPTAWTIPGDGVYIVGIGAAADVRPGLYRSQDNRRCSWRTAKDATFEHRSLVASDTSSGDAYVELKSGEFFDTNDCSTWHRATGPRAPR